jgi:hypothetical protein
MSTKAKTNSKYIDADASVSIESKITDLESTLKSMSFQFDWDVGVIGVVDFYASVFPFPYKWERLVSCETVTFNTVDSETNSEIVSLPDIWLNTGFIRFEFQPEGGSVGNLRVASRIVPT